ncbi:hypothetical protein [Methanolobus vulcani]|uniref:Uncharacterized protein n=1 Tax=Methanolobus vulcani TaxID=38026 RepID=A0A7Z8KMN5_9EURY|nr:hypothetical protein [Methanolobus vulcani]TQD23827.1 hypothetical protein FKV42_11450 [Methanolobus vulcani]
MLSGENLSVKKASIAALVIFILIFSGVVSATVTTESEIMNGSELSEDMDVYINESTFQGFIYHLRLYNVSNSSQSGITENHSHRSNSSYTESFLSNDSIIEIDGNIEFNMSYQISSNIDEIEAGNKSPFLDMNNEKSTALKSESSCQNTRPYTEIKIQMINGPSVLDGNGNRVFPDDAEVTNATMIVYYEADYPLLGEMTYPAVTVAPYEYVSCFQHFCTGRKLVNAEKVTYKEL